MEISASRLAPPTAASRFLADAGTYRTPRQLKRLASSGRVRCHRLANGTVVFNLDDLLVDLRELAGAA